MAALAVAIVIVERLDDREVAKRLLDAKSSMLTEEERKLVQRVERMTDDGHGCLPLGTGRARAMDHGGRIGHALRTFMALRMGVGGDTNTCHPEWWAVAFPVTTLVVGEGADALRFGHWGDAPYWAAQPDLPPWAPTIKAIREALDEWDLSPLEPEPEPEATCV